MSKNINLELTYPRGLEGKYHDFLTNEKFTEMAWLGSFGCISENQGVYNPKLDREIAVREYLDNPDLECWVVSWTDAGFVPAKALGPVRKGKRGMYRVTLSNGESFEATDNHHFLTPDGWLSVSDANDDDQPVELLASSLFLPHSSRDTDQPAFPEDALHYWGTIQGSLSDCRLSHRSYDAQPPRSLVVAQGVPPSLGDAPRHTRDGHSSGDRVLYGDGSRLSALSRRSSPGAFSRAEHHGVALQSPPSAYTSSTREYYRPDDQSGPVFPEQSISLLQRGDGFQLRGVRNAIDQACPNTTIKNIQYIGEMEYYDLEVPVWENYVAAGVVHHNTSKSDCLVTSILHTAFTYPGCTMVLARDELTNLKRTTLADLLQKAPELIEHHNKTESVLTFPEVPDHDGVPKASTLYCFGLMSGDYKQKLKSLQPFRIFIDEGDKIHEEMFDMCVLRLRQKAYNRETGKLGKNQVKIVANDEGNNWLWRRFVGKEHPGMEMTPEWVKSNIGIREELYQPEGPQDVYVGDIALHHGVKRLVRSVDEGGEVLVGEPPKKAKVDELKIVLQRYCIYAFTHENLSLNQQNVRNSRLVSQAMRDKYILGKVDTQTGLLFPGFDPGVNVIPKQEVPKDWRIVVGIDHGYEHPTAATFLAVDPSGNLIVFDEFKVRHQSASDNAQDILMKVDGFDRVTFFADSQMWNVDPRHPGENIAKDYQDQGVKPLRKANKNRELSIDRIKEYLKPRQSLGQVEATPRLRVMSNCTETINTLFSMTWENFRAKKHDDILDSLRYGSMAIYDHNSMRNGKPITPIKRAFTVG